MVLYEITVDRVGMITCEDYYDGVDDLECLIMTTFPLIKKEWYSGQQN